MKNKFDIISFLDDLECPFCEKVFVLKSLKEPKLLSLRNILYYGFGVVYRDRNMQDTTIGFPSYLIYEKNYSFGV